MKLGKLLSILLCAYAVMTLAVMSVSADSTFGVNVKLDGSQFVSAYGVAKSHDGLVTLKTATLTDGYQYDDVTRVVKIVPNKSYTGTNPIGIKHTSVASMQYTLKDIKYVRYYYYYTGDYSGRAKLVLPASEFNLTKDCVVYSMETLEKNRWTYLTFNIEDVIYGYVYTGGSLANMQFYPFGDTKPSALSSDELLLREIYLWGKDNVNTLAALSSGTLVPRYPVSFVPGRSDSVGTAPETVWVEVGEEIILPENTFTREGYTFAGWICGVGSKVMQPGDKYVVEERKRVGGPDTATLDFIANWQPIKEEEGVALLPAVNRVGYTAFCGGIVDGRKYGSLTRPVMFDGLETVKFTYDENGKDVSKYQVSFDGWTWNTLPLDLAHYKCLIIPYYYKTSGTKSFIPLMNMLGGSDRALSKSYTVSSSTGNLKRNQWAVMAFTFDYETNAGLNKLIQWDYSTVVNQIHFWMFGNGKASSLVPGDELYLGDFVFLNYVPEKLSTLTFSKGFLTGDEDGYARPLDELTNAEAASILAKSNGFTVGSEASYTATTYTDVKSGDWFLPYVSYLESKGILPGKGKFNPNAKCPFDDYVEWTVKASAGGAASDGDFGKLPVSESAAGITRASAVNLALNIMKGVSYNTSDAQKIIGDEALYPDVSKNQWFYPDIVFSSLPTLSYTVNGDSKVVDVYYNKPVKEEDFPQDKLDEGSKYVAELDRLTIDRINEILLSDSQYTQKKGGRTHYVSSSGGSGTTGSSSEDNPIYVKTLNEASSIPLAPGDVVLFKRGDVFRGNLTAQAGVTYSAYGSGDKPKLITSPENASGKDKWELYYSDETGKKIWKFKNGELPDIGAINLISDGGEHLIAYKEIPSYYANTFWVRGKVEMEEYDVITQLDNDYEFVHLAQYQPGSDYEKLSLSGGVPANNAVGPIYLRCDDGNPGTLYPRIEFNGDYHTIRCNGDSITIDNLCLLYFGRHGVSAGTNHNLTVRNCEIGWGGGSVQSYNTSSGSATRFGNGVEIYGALTNYTIDNCYVYEIYDAGITHQISGTSSGNYYMEGVYYTNNVLVNSTYNIEYFMSMNTVKDSATGTVPLQERYMKNVYFTDNIVRKAGYGWGVQRPDSAPSNIKGWTHHNLSDNYIIEGNIFDRCLDLQNFRTDYNVMLGTTYESSTPYMKNNIFVQTPGRILMTFHKTSYMTDLNSEELLTKLAGPGNKVYFYPDDEKEYWGNVHWRDLEAIRENKK
ncbi:MAG: S-layer homology domain-containing protein [Clostridia bacterium]|nr:S-layer homology domain-containing protein [Clostridia bacterium]